MNKNKKKRNNVIRIFSRKKSRQSSICIDENVIKPIVECKNALTHIRLIIKRNEEKRKIVSTKVLFESSGFVSLFTLISADGCFVFVDLLIDGSEKNASTV